MIRKIIERTRAILAFERALAAGTPLREGREARRVSRAIGLDPDKANALIAGAVPFDAITTRTDRIRLSSEYQVRFPYPIAEAGHVQVRSIGGSVIYREGTDYRVDRETSSIRALHDALEFREVDVEYLSVDRSVRETYFERTMEWAKDGR